MPRGAAHPLHHSLRGPHALLSGKYNSHFCPVLGLDCQCSRRLLLGPSSSALRPWRLILVALLIGLSSLASPWPFLLAPRRLLLAASTYWRHLLAATHHLRRDRDLANNASISGMVHTKHTDVCHRHLKNQLLSPGPWAPPKPYLPPPRQLGYVQGGKVLLRVR